MTVNGRNGGSTVFALPSSANRVLRFALNPAPLRVLLLRRLVERLRLGSYYDRMIMGAVARPWYANCVYNGAALAKALHIDRISVVEFGVAGGDGLICLENHAREVEKELGVAIGVYGFDSGEGLPAPRDYRDSPYTWKAGGYRMEKTRVEARLRSAKLVLGDVAHTLPRFLNDPSVPPLAAVAFDLDLYSSTAAALAILEADPARLLPRVKCYFDDIVGYEAQLPHALAGERLSIREFNERNRQRRFIDHAHSFKGQWPAPWQQQIFACHVLDHPLYSEFVGEPDQSSKLS